MSSFQQDVSSFNNLGPILSEQVALVRSIFLRYLSIFSQKISSIVKSCHLEFYHYKTVAAYQNKTSQLPL